MHVAQAVARATRGDVLAEYADQHAALQHRHTSLSRFTDQLAASVNLVCKAFGIGTVWVCAWTCDGRANRACLRAGDEGFVRDGGSVYPSKASLDTICARAPELMRVEAECAALTKDVADLTVRARVCVSVCVCVCRCHCVCVSV